MGTSSAIGLFKWLKRNARPFTFRKVVHLSSVVLRQGRQPQGRRPETATMLALGLTLLILMLVASCRQAQLKPEPDWSRIGPFDGRINVLLIDDSGPTGTLYAGTDGGVFKSVDLGKSWIPCNKGLKDRLIRALVLNPDDPNILYAGTWNGKVYISPDAGKSWQEISDNLPPYEIRALAVHTRDPRNLYAGLAVDPTDPRRLYIGNPPGVFTTTVTATACVTSERWLSAKWQAVESDQVLPTIATCVTVKQWLPAGRFTGTLQCMVMDPEKPNWLYVGTADHGLYKSTDGGATWFHSDPNFSDFGDFHDVSALTILPRNPSTLYAISKGKVCRTENGGVVWKYADFWRDQSVALCLAINPKDAREVYVGLQDGLHKSNDARQTWARSDTGLPTPEPTPVDLRTPTPKPKGIQVVAVHPIMSNLVYACSGSQVFISTDSGATWKEASTINTNAAAGILALESDPKNGSVFYASTEGGGMYKTTDKGEHWQHIGEGLPASWITSIVIDPINTQLVYVGTDQGYVFKSWDGGNSWAPIGGVTESVKITALAVDPEQPQRIYAGTAGRGLFRSDDAGRNWVYKGSDIGAHIRRIIIDPRGPQVQVYAHTERGVYQSANAAEEWGFYLSPVADIAAFTKGQQSLLVLPFPDRRSVQGQGVNESVTPLPSGPMATGTGFKALTASRAQPQTFYALAKGQGLLRSTDQGAHWEPLTPGPEGRELRVLALSVDNPNLILIGTDQGIYRYQPGE